MEVFGTIWVILTVTALIRMAFRPILGKQPQLPPRDAEDVRVEMVDEEPEYELPDDTE